MEKQTKQPAVEAICNMKIKELEQNKGCIECDFSPMEERRIARKETLNEVRKIRLWLKDIIWCNAHDTAWIEETITKLKSLEQKA